MSDVIITPERQYATPTLTVGSWTGQVALVECRVEGMEDEGIDRMLRMGHPALGEIDLGSASFRTRGFSYVDKPDLARFHRVIDADPTLIELDYLHTHEDFRGIGIGRIILDHSKQFAREMGRTLYLRPETPDDGRTHPLTTKQLREMYLRHGFREFTPKEVSRYENELTNQYMTYLLWCLGISSNRDKGHALKEQPMPLDKAAELGRIPLGRKIRMAIKAMGRFHGTGRNEIDEQRRGRKRLIRKHLVVA